MTVSEKDSSVAVVIPTLNEAGTLARSLESVLRQSVRVSEIRVVDGGSTDGTPDAAEAFGPVQVTRLERADRSYQMNEGARLTRSPIILFLHADTILPPDGIRKIIALMDDRRIVGGGFRRRFETTSSFLRMTCSLADIRGRAFGWFLGDQAIFCRRATFAQLGGFPDMHPFEDLAFSRMLRNSGQTCLVDSPVLSSARRFEKEGPLRRTCKDFLLTLDYLRTSSVHRNKWE